MTELTDNRGTTVAGLLAALMPGPARRLLMEVQDMTTTAPALDLVLEHLPVDDQTAVEVDLAGDIGNARAAILSQASGQPAQLLVMPSLRSLDVVFAADIFDRRGLPSNAWARLGPDEHVLDLAGGVRFVGRLAVEYARAQSSGRGSDVRYSDGTTAEFLYAGLAAANPKATNFAVRLVSLLPIKLWRQHAATVEASLKGPRKFGYKGRQISARFEYVKAVREGEAAYHGLPKKPMGRCVIVDGGGRTVNVALFSDGQYSDGDTIDNMGLEAALDAVDRRLEIDGVRRLTFAERLDLLDAVRQGQQYSIIHRQVAYPIHPIARVTFDRFTSTLGQELARLLPMDAAEAGVFVGGAAYPHFFGNGLHQLYPVLDLADDPETRNVVGALAMLNGAAPRKVKKAR